MNKIQWAEYLNKIEKCEDSMSEGRRNNDIVNWTMACMALKILAGEDCIDINAFTLQQQFDDAFGGKIMDGKYLLNYDWEEKIELVVNSYWKLQPEELEALLIDVEY